MAICVIKAISCYKNLLEKKISWLEHYAYHNQRIWVKNQHDFHKNTKQKSILQFSSYKNIWTQNSDRPIRIKYSNNKQYSIQWQWCKHYSSSSLCFPVNLFSQSNISERQTLALKTGPWLEHLSVSHLATSPHKCTILSSLSPRSGLLRRVWVCVCMCVCGVFWELWSSRYSTPYWPGSPFSEQRTIPTETKQPGKRTVPKKHSHTHTHRISHNHTHVLA